MKAYALFSVFFFSSLVYSASNVLVGLSAKDVTPSIESKIPLGGYGGPERRQWLNFFTKKPHWRMFHANKGALDQIRSKVMVIYRPDTDQRLLFISLDVVGVTKEMHQDILKRLAQLGFKSDSVILSATHTHSGPGALAKNPIWEIMAMDRFQRDFYNRFLGQIEDSVKEAIENLEESELYTLSFATQELVRNRRGRDRPVFHDANLIMVKSKLGHWRGGMINFAVHGTHFDEDNLFFSSDVPGAVERSMQDLLDQHNGYVRQRNDPVFLFVNGASGDISPHKDYIELGESFADQASEHWNQMQFLEPEWKVGQLEVDLGKPQINLSKCIKKSWIPKSINAGLKRWISSKTIINQVHFQNLWLMSFPGEATTEIGMKLRQEAKESGAENAWVFGLTNDHLAYFVTPEEFEVGGYEACTNFFGSQGGLKVVEAHKNLSQKL